MKTLLILLLMTGCAYAKEYKLPSGRPVSEIPLQKNGDTFTANVDRVCPGGVKVTCPGKEKPRKKVKFDMFYWFPKRNTPLLEKNDLLLIDGKNTYLLQKL